MFSKILPLIAVFYICLVSVSFAQDVDDLTYITENYPPYNYMANGQVQGISVDVLRAMWSEMGYPEQPIKVLPWARGYHLTLQKRNHVLFAMAKTETREDLFKWLGPIYSVKHVLIGLAGKDIKIRSIEEAKKYQIGTILKDVAEELLKAFGFDKRHLQSVSALEQSIQKLKIGRIKLIAYSEKAFWDYVKVQGYDQDKFKTVFVLDSLKGYYAFNKNTPESLVQRFQKTLKSIESKRQKIVRQYLN